MEGVLSAVAGGVFFQLLCLTYLHPLEGKKGLPLRLALAAPVMAAAFLLLAPRAGVWSFTLLLLALGYLLGRCCFRGERGIVLYLNVWSTLSYLLLYELWQICAWYLLPDSLTSTPARLLVALGLGALICVPLWLTVRRWMSVYISGHVGPRQLISALLLAGIFVAMMSNFYVEGIFQPQYAAGPLVLMSQTYAITILYLQTALFRKSAMQQELDTLNLLWHQQAEQYQLARENIDLINRKCHDLKHMVAAMRTMEGEESRERYLREIEDSVQIYDSMVKTGNDTLDTVLTEKSLQCEANHITVNCVADGAQLHFIDPVDLYTILGNALDNAMEAVKAFQTPEKRCIDVLIHVRQRFLVLSITNPLKDTLTFREGLPLSRKPKNGYHGYGMRSIRHTARKYGGEMTVDTEHGCFSLRIMIPLPEEVDPQ